MAGLALTLAAAAAGAKAEKIEGYAEWRRGDLLVVDGQRVKPAPGIKFKAHGDARDFASIPLGYEIKLEGERQADGVVLASRLEAKPNGSAMFESDLRQSFDQMEKTYLKAGKMFEQDAKGKEHIVGKLRDEGPDVARVRRLTTKLVPPYLKPEDFRVYVVENEEWNAMAAPNRSIYVFSGLLADMDDDEVAIVLGHELTHATYEHSRKAYKRDLLIQLATVGTVVAADQAVDGKSTRTAIDIAAMLTSSAMVNGYGRANEDQADRVGLRYAYEGGFDVVKGPKLWNRFAAKYGEGDKTTNFFFGDHSVAKDRARNLERELAVNYGQR
jgi:Zn-dependent protease with chaperone function